MEEALTLGWRPALWGLAVLPLFVLLALRSRYPIGARRRWLAAAARMFAAALLVLALADLRWGRPSTELALASVIDRTESIAEPDRQRAAAELRALADASSDLTFIEAAPATSRARPATDVAAAVASLPRDRARRLVVATDGRDPGSALGGAIAAARRAGVEVHVLPMGDDPPIDLASVRGLSVPRLVRAGDRIDVGVEVHASRSVEAQLTLFVNGEERARERASVPAGGATVSMPFEAPAEEGVHQVAIQLSVPGDLRAENDAWRSLLRVAPKPRVRLFHDPRRGAPTLRAVLEEGGLDVEVSPLESAPYEASAYDPYALVLIDEAELNDLTESQQQAMRDWVEEEGGGLITITGDRPVRRIPRILREIEPVSVPPAIPEPRPLELIIVIDRSGSMQGARMMQARNAGVAAVRALREDARVGVVAFSGAADRVLPTVGMDQREEVIQFIQGIQAGGGTDIAAALRAANGIVSADSRYIRHVVLLSDGISSAPPALEAARAVAGRGVSITAISIGPRTELMADIARIGRGRYHVTQSVGSLPSIFVREAQYRQPPAHRRGSFSLRAESLLPGLEGVPFNEAPPLSGHALATLRPGASLVLSSSERRPILAHWHRGLGQVATFTSATSGGWADRLRTWEGYRSMWVGLAEEMLRTRPIQPPVLSLAPHPLVDGVQVLTVISPLASARPRPLITLHRDRDGGRELELVDRGLGIFQADVFEDDGFLVEARMPEDREPGRAIAFDRPYDLELATFGSDRPSLEALAAAGGGQLLASLEPLVAEPESIWVMRSLRLPLLVLALLAYLFGLLLVRLPDGSVSATVVRPSRKSQPAPAPRGAARRVKEAA